MNGKDCINYAQGYCCPSHKHKCGLPRNKCRMIVHCGYGFGRIRCHLKTDSDKCVMFKHKE